MRATVGLRPPHPEAPSDLEKSHPSPLKPKGSEDWTPAPSRLLIGHPRAAHRLSNRAAVALVNKVQNGWTTEKHRSGQD